MKNVKDTVQRILSVTWSWEKDAMDELLGKIGAFPAQDSDSSSEERKFTDKDGAFADAVYNCEFRGPLVFFPLASADLNDLDESARDEVISAFDEKFEAAVEEVTSIIGEPDYTGPASGSDMTEGQFADSLACWLREDGRLMVQMGQRDTELPLEIAIVMAARHRG